MKPTLYAHELLGKGGIWLACDSEEDMVNSYVEGKTGKEILALVKLSEVESRIQQLEEMLRWYIEEDEINECDPENEYWIEGKHKAMRLLGMEVESD